MLQSSATLVAAVVVVLVREARSIASLPRYFCFVRQGGENLVRRPHPEVERVRPSL